MTRMGGMATDKKQRCGCNDTSRPQGHPALDAGSKKKEGHTDDADGTDAHVSTKRRE